MNGEIEGIVQGHVGGHGFVLRDDGQPDIHLAASQMRAALHRDRVRVRIIGQDGRGRPEGQVVEILERGLKTVIGRLLKEDGQWLVAPEDRRYGQDILIPDAATGDADAGQVVVAELSEPPALYGAPVGRVVEVLGELDDPGIEIEIAVRKFGVPQAFSEACLRAAQRLPASVRSADRRGRVDLTDVPLVTIDGVDARDFDDAVYCEPMPGRGAGWRLLVAIADVSHYVPRRGAIDADAYERATSVYFPRQVLPMLPEKLSNGICSLNPKEDRLCLVCDMVVDAKGQVTAYQFYPAVMNSKARLNYDEVAAALANTRGPEAVRLEAVLPQLLDLHAVFRALLKERQRRGAVEFDTTETEILCNELGRIEAIVPRKRNDAHRLIEECMLAANVCAADFIHHHRRKALYRVHEGPVREKVEQLRAALKALGLNQRVSDQPSPQEFQRIVAATAQRPDAEQIQMLLLRSMSQAVYTPHNSGHFGLAYDAYTHFTSPIRRYPDLLLHRVIKALLEGRRFTLPALPEEGALEQAFARRMPEPPKSRKRKPTQQMQRWELAGLHCSACERRAEEASRDVEAWLKCDYMRQHLGEEFSGTVSSVTSFGLFITLDDLYVDGLAHISELGSEYFHYDEARQSLRGEHSGVRYAMGTRVRVQVSRVDLDARQVDFHLLPASGASANGGKRHGAASKKRKDATVDAGGKRKPAGRNGSTAARRKRG